jgi:hypothetical protein
VGVDGVGLASLTGGEDPRPRGQFRGHVHHRFAVGDQALGEVSANTVAALDRPGAIRVAAANLEHRLVALAVGAESALCKDFLPFVDDFDCC